MLLRSVIVLILFISLPIFSYSGTNNQSLKVFFRSDCAPCLREIKIIPEIAGAHPGLMITVITLDSKPISSRFPPNVAIVAGDGKDRKIMIDAGDTSFALPYSVFIRKDGTVCSRHYGILGTDLVSKWVRRC